MAISLQQARQELNQASGGSNNNEWLTARTDDEVRAKYKELNGADVEGATTGAGAAGDVAGGYAFLPMLLQLLQQSVQSGQFQQNYGLNLGSLTGYAPSAGSPLSDEQVSGGYDKAMSWYQGFKTRTGRAPTRDEWITGVQASTGMTPQQAGYVYDTGVGAFGVPNKEQFTELVRQSGSQTGGQEPTLQRQQFETNLAMQLAQMDRTDPYASREARLGLQPGLEQGAEDIFRRLQGGGDLPQYGGVPNPGQIPPVRDVGGEEDRLIRLDPREWRGFPGDRRPRIPDQIPFIPGITTGAEPRPEGLPYLPGPDTTPGRGYPAIPGITTGNPPRPNPQARLMSATGVPNPSPISTAPLSSANIPLGGHQIDYGRLRNLLPSELQTVATDLRAKNINPEDYFAASRRAQPTGAGRIGASRYI